MGKRRPQLIRARFDKRENELFSSASVYCVLRLRFVFAQWSVRHRTAATALAVCAHAARHEPLCTAKHCDVRCALSALLLLTTVAHAAAAALSALIAGTDLRCSAQTFNVHPLVTWCRRNSLFLYPLRTFCVHKRPSAHQIIHKYGRNSEKRRHHSRPFHSLSAAVHVRQKFSTITRPLYRPLRCVRLFSFLLACW